jgi:chromatin remodeling complex protein RSC6
MATIESLSADVATLRSDIKNLAKLVRKVRNFQEDPTGEKNKERTKNNGFNRQMNVSDTLRDFLSLGADESISRSEVTRRVNAYIKDKELKHPDNGRVIVMDEKLTKLLAPPGDVQVTFLNMQKYISPHYLSPAPLPPDDNENKLDTLAEAASVVEEKKADVEVKKATQKRPTVRKPKA